MRVLDTRPPFAGLANLSEGALASLPTPCYLLDEAQLRRNGEILLGVQQRTGCKILLAQKAFSNFDLYPLLAPYLAGTEASGLYESRLGKEELPEKENHVFCAAYRVDEFNELLDYADHIVFNSPAQLAKFGPAAKAAGKSVGLRINPERSTALEISRLLRIHCHDFRRVHNGAASQCDNEIAAFLLGKMSSFLDDLLDRIRSDLIKQHNLHTCEGKLFHRTVKCAARSGRFPI